MFYKYKQNRIPSQQKRLESLDNDRERTRKVIKNSDLTLSTSSLLNRHVSQPGNIVIMDLLNKQLKDLELHHNSVILHQFNIHKRHTSVKNLNQNIATIDKVDK